ncbi:MAG: hypothetical protein LUM44_16390 [Pyrinomonadaceae bacterium]|nr:hypothetical protein [Pyrinomonadaceae bacterium]
MKNNILLTILIAFGFIGLGLLSLMMMVFAGFVFCGDIDLADDVRANCISKTNLLSLVCSFSLIGSIFGLFLSGAISKRLSNLLGNDSVTSLDL